MNKQELYQCPYDKACKCAQLEPCNGCETWAEAKMIPYTSLKDELIEVINTMKFYSPQESEYVIKADVVIEAIKELDK